MEEKEFWKDYWFNPLKIVTVKNPTDEDFTFGVVVDIGIDFMSGQVQNTNRKFTIGANGKARWPGPVVNMYLDQMFKKRVQEDHTKALEKDKKANLVANMADFAWRKKYYDDLIVEVIDSVDSFAPNPQYLEGPANEETEKKRMGRPPKVVA